MSACEYCGEYNCSGWCYDDYDDTWYDDYHDPHDDYARDIEAFFNDEISKEVFIESVSGYTFVDNFEIVRVIEEKRKKKVV